MTAAALRWSAHPDPAEAVGETVGSLVTGDGATPQVAVVVVAPELAPTAGIVVRAAARLLGADRTVGIVAPIAPPAGVSAASPTLLLWVVQGRTTRTVADRLRIGFCSGPTGADDVTGADLTVVLDGDPDDVRSPLWTPDGAVTGGRLDLELPADVVVGTPTARGGRRNGTPASGPCIGSASGVEPFVLVTGRRGGATGLDGVGVRVGDLLLRSPDGPGHRHTPASVALFPEPSEESA